MPNWDICTCSETLPWVGNCAMQATRLGMKLLWLFLYEWSMFDDVYIVKHHLFVTFRPMHNAPCMVKSGNYQKLLWGFFYKPSSCESRVWRSYSENTFHSFLWDVMWVHQLYVCRKCIWVRLRNCSCLVTWFAELNLNYCNFDLILCPWDEKMLKFIPDQSFYYNHAIFGTVMTIWYLWLGYMIRSGFCSTVFGGSIYVSCLS